MEERSNPFRDAPILARLNEDDARALAASGRVRSYPAGAVIFYQGDPGDSLHAIIKGQVRITLENQSGEETVLAVLGPGDCMGELALLDGRPRSGSAVAVQDTSTLVVTRDTFERWVAERPGAALALLETLSLRLRRTNESLAEMTFVDLPHRLARRLVELASAQRKKGGAAVRLAVTQAELGVMLGASRESVNKQLNQFRREGWIDLGRGAVIVQDIEALRAFLE